jgi:adenylate kinase family enzyme
LRKIVIFGNSGSGKSTLAKELKQAEGLAHLDLDSIAWQPSSPPERKSMAESTSEINEFINSNDRWVIEGCYSDLLEVVIPASSEIIFLNLPVEACIANAKNRPWEPHKYESKQAQDANLNMLTNWIAQYTERDDIFSQSAHETLFKGYEGKKTMYTKNECRAKTAPL